MKVERLTIDEQGIFVFVVLYLLVYNLIGLIWL